MPSNFPLLTAFLYVKQSGEVDQCCIAFFFSFGEKVNELEHLLFKEERSCLVPVKENALAFCI